MPAVIDATTGGRASNSYDTIADATNYFTNRAAIVPDITDADDESAMLIMATRVLEANMRGTKRLVAETTVPHYVIGRYWNGAPATKTQKLPWPRTGLTDVNGVALDIPVTITPGNPLTTLVVTTPHRRQTGDKVLIFNLTGGSPNLNGEQTVTYVDDYTLTIPVVSTVAGTGGSITWIPQELKDAVAEFAGQLVGGDRTLDNDVIVQGLTALKAGSVSLNFKSSINPQVLPDAVTNLLLPSWYTEEGYENANAAEFGVVSSTPGGCW